MLQWGLPLAIEITFPFTFAGDRRDLESPQHAPPRGGDRVARADLADRSQGRDFDCVILSTTRSNDGGHVGSLLADWRRMNVAFSRARAVAFAEELEGTRRRFAERNAAVGEAATLGELEAAAFEGHTPIDGGGEAPDAVADDRFRSP